MISVRFLGIDYGVKRVGIALSDESGTLAFPKAILKNDHTLMPEIKGLCRNEHVGAIVIGESTDNRGAPNPVMKNILAFVHALERATNLPVHFEREFMTSAQVRREGGEGQSDAGAATLILQSYIDRKANGAEN